MLLLAVSGGIDSMCLAEKVRLSGGPFAVAHCNFSLRGDESDADEAHVRAWAAEHGIPCHVKRFDTRAFAQEQGISVEMAARRLRYRWFGQLCREFGYEGVAVAHNANDNAETLILNLLRGTGLRGITGMKENGFLPDPDYADIPLLRPLLRMTRAEIEAFAKENGLSWREDGTNALNDCKRNMIRNLVFPVFADINPSFVQTLNRDMARFRTEMALVHENGPFGAREGEKKALVHENGPFGAREGEFTMSEEAWDGSLPVKQPEGMLILDADKAGIPAGTEPVIGPWKSGDWIRPLGAPGKKKMQDWFTDHHIPAGEKPFVPLLRSPRDPQHILAVVPFCIDHSVRVGNSTRRIIRISVKND